MHDKKRRKKHFSQDFERVSKRYLVKIFIRDARALPGVSQRWGIG